MRIIIIIINLQLAKKITTITLWGRQVLAKKNIVTSSGCPYGCSKEETCHSDAHMQLSRRTFDGITTPVQLIKQNCIQIICGSCRSKDRNDFGYSFWHAYVVNLFVGLV
jgi:hypothetical protein